MGSLKRVLQRKEIIMEGNYPEGRVYTKKIATLNYLLPKPNGT